MFARDTVVHNISGVHPTPILLTAKAINDAFKSQVNATSDVSSSTGSLVLRMPLELGQSPIASGDLLAIPNSPLSSIPQINSGSNRTKATVKSTPIKPPKKYRPPGEDCEIQRCKRSLSFVGGTAGTQASPTQPQGSIEDERPPQQQRPRATVERRNKRERLRVKQINNTFVTLRNQLPNNCWSPKRNAKKFSKVDTLRMAIEYIRGLQELIQDHDAMYMSAECLALLSSPGTIGGGAVAVEGMDDLPYSSVPCSASVTTDSDRSGAESVASSAPDQQVVGPSLGQSFTYLLTGMNYRNVTDNLFDDFSLDDCII